MTLGIATSVGLRTPHPDLIGGEANTLPDEISDRTSLLRNQLDRQMTKFRTSNPEFYAGYRSARVIVDRGGGSRTVPPSAAKAAVAA